jgi:hypothetical protein
MKFLKQLLKKWNVTEAQAAEIILTHVQKKHIKKGRPPSKLELQLTMSLGIKKIYERQKTKSIKRAAELYLNSRAFQVLGAETIGAKRLQNIVHAFQNEFAQSPRHLGGIASLVLIPKRNKKKVSRK